MNLLNGKKLAVIGDPIGHSLSPVIQQAMLDALGLDCTYERIRVPGGATAEDRKSTRLNSSHPLLSRMPSSA